MTGLHVFHAFKEDIKGYLAHQKTPPPRTLQHTILCLPYGGPTGGWGCCLLSEVPPQAPLKLVFPSSWCGSRQSSGPNVPMWARPDLGPRTWWVGMVAILLLMNCIFS